MLPQQLSSVNNCFIVPTPIVVKMVAESTT